MNIITEKEKLRAISSVFGEPDLSKDGKNASVACSSCGKKHSIGKKKLSICLETGMYHCWVCELKGKNIAFLAKKLKAPEEILSILSACFGRLSGESPEEESNEIALPDDFTLLSSVSQRYAAPALAYLKKRGITKEDIIKYKIGVSNEYEYTNRIIFPSFNEDLRLNFFLSRTYDENTYQKYKNCDGQKRSIIFNEYMIDWSSRVVLVEGVFDAIKAGENSVCMLGSWIDNSHALFQKIIEHQTPVTLAMDPDAHAKAQKIAQALSSYCIDVNITENKDFDFGEMTKKQANFYISNAKHFDVYNRMRYLIDEIKSGSIF